MADWVRIQGGNLHSLSAQLSDANGPLNIPLGTTVSFAGRLIGNIVATIGGAAQVTRAGAEIDDPNRGFIHYDLSTADVSTPGIFNCLWYIVPPNSSQIQPFPEDSYMVLIILPSI